MSAILVPVAVTMLMCCRSVVRVDCGNISRWVDVGSVLSLEMMVVALFFIRNSKPGGYWRREKDWVI